MSALVIGLTGNIATGKSTVAHMLAERGAVVIDADRVAHQVMEAGAPVHAAIVETFGPAVLGPDGEINRGRLGALAFASPQAMARLEALVHPAVGAEVQRRLAAAAEGVVVIEAIKLIEAGLADDCDSVWVTTCPPALRVQRLVTERGLSRSEAEQRVDAQPPQEAKFAHADVVIDTSGAMAETSAQVEAAWNRLVQEASGGLGREDDSEYNESRPGGPLARLAGVRRRKVIQPAAPAAPPDPVAPSRSVLGLEQKLWGYAMNNSHSDILVRRARPQDAERIAAFVNQARPAGEAVTPDEVRSRFGVIGFMLAERDDRIIGLLGWQVENLVARVTDFFVSPASERLVAGRAMVAAMEDAARDLQCEAAMLFVPRKAPPEVLSFWEAFEYTPREVASLPKAWREVAREVRALEEYIVLKQLREGMTRRPI